MSVYPKWEIVVESSAAAAACSSGPDAGAIFTVAVTDRFFNHQHPEMNFSSSNHQNIVGMSFESAQSTLASLKASGVVVRVTKPGQVAAPPSLTLLFSRSVPPPPCHPHNTAACAPTD